jgi:hypothetical protein
MGDEIMVMAGDPVNGFRLIGPINTDSEALVALTDRVLKHDTWWYLHPTTVAGELTEYGIIDEYPELLAPPTTVLCVRDPDSSNEFTIEGPDRPRIIDVDLGYAALNDFEEFSQWADTLPEESVIRSQMEEIVELNLDRYGPSWAGSREWLAFRAAALTGGIEVPVDPTEIRNAAELHELLRAVLET